MNIKSAVFASVIALGSACAAIAQEVVLETISLTNFGASAFTDDSWTYNSSTGRLNGTEGLGFLVYGEPAATDFSRSFGQITDISVTANVASLASAPLNGFSVVLIDGADRSASAFFNWVDFVGGQTVSVELSNVTPNFDYNNVIFWNLVGGSSNSPIDVVLTNISGLVVSNVPEPSTYAALAGMVVLGAVTVRRRRSA